jgi:hypothetical protein
MLGVDMKVHDKLGDAGGRRRQWPLEENPMMSLSSLGKHAFMFKGTHANGFKGEAIQGELFQTPLHVPVLDGAWNETASQCGTRSTSTGSESIW